jgi:hypothetical protein
VATATAPTPAQILATYLGAAVRRSQEAPTQNWNAGNVLAFGMPHAGVGLYVRVTFRGTLTRTETATVGTVTASPLYPYNIVDATYQDYQGITRVNAKGYELHELQNIKAFGFDPSFTLIPPGASPGYSYSSTIFANAVPAGVASSQTTSACNFGFVVPISMNRRSVKGSHPFTVPNSEDTLSLACNGNLYGTANNGPEQPFITTGASTVSISGTFDVAYYYYDVPGGVALPMSEFGVVHELITAKDTTNLAAGMEKRFTLQTGRTYYRLLANLCLDGAADTVDVNKVQFIVDGGTPTLTENLSSYLDRTRDDYGRDLPVGQFVWDFSNKPWTPDSYGSLDLSLTLGSGANTGSPSYLRVLRECLYVASPNLQAIG